MDLLAQADAWVNVPVGEHLFYFSPMIALVSTMLAIVLAPIVWGRGARSTAAIATLGVVITFVLSLRVARAVAGGAQSGLSTEPGAGILIADNLSVCFQLILLVFMAGVMWLWSVGSAERERNAPEFFILLLGSALGMMLMVSTQNLLMMVVAMETASLPSYAFVGFDKRDRMGAEASLKYMVFGAICAACMLYGISLLYGLVGSLNAADVAAYTIQQLDAGENRIVLAVALLCVLAGIAFKVSAVPFHFWCPDAFEGAKIEVTTWLSVASKAAGLLLLARLSLVFCAAVDYPVSMQAAVPLAWTIGILAMITCTYGNFCAYRQRSVKRLLAYSSIAHAGYMMMAVAVFIHPNVPGHEAGLTALFVYVTIYLFMNLGAFGATALVSWETGSDKIEAFTGLARRAPWVAVPMIVCLMSLVGIPPLAGFIGKWWILVALGGMGAAGGAQGGSSLSTLGWVLVFVAVLNTLISLFYYLRVVVQMALQDDEQPAVRPPVGGVVLVNVCAAMLLVLFFLAQPLKTAANRFSRDIFRTAAAWPSSGTESMASADREAD